MAWLLVDNSNTRTKFALADEGGLLAERGVLDTAALSPESLESLLAGWAFRAALVASVVPVKAELLHAWLGARGEVRALDWRSPLGIGLDYPHPEQIGADRLANAVGVVARHGAPAVVIDFGTAVTFDVISAAGEYCGGVIAPGLGAMSGYLSRRTALLPEIELSEPPRAIGKSTAEAMRSGAVFGYRGLVRGILSRLREELGSPPIVVATGGDAALIARGMGEIDRVDPEITLEGIRQVACRCFGGNEV